ncbi:hypothetical protein L1887_51879 [Cichorium endivia]|nr:hypothetical protein L1887_51879 [Cichorium endivia]
MAGHVKRTLDQKFGPTWHAVVGQRYGSYVTHETKHFIYFSLVRWLSCSGGRNARRLQFRNAFKSSAFNRQDGFVPTAGCGWMAATMPSDGIWCGVVSPAALALVGAVFAVGSGASPPRVEDAGCRVGGAHRTAPHVVRHGLGAIEVRGRAYAPAVRGAAGAAARPRARVGAPHAHTCPPALHRGS